MCSAKIIFLCGFMLLNITAFLNTVSAKFTDEVQVLVKEGAERDDNRIHFGDIEVRHSFTFPQFLSFVNVFIDRSMFIKFVIEKFVSVNERFIITFPSRWGKTTLQSMVKFFFSVQLKEDLELVPKKETAAYQYFHEGKVEVNGIMHTFNHKPLLFKQKINTDEIDKYLANHPVIHLDLCNMYTRGDRVEHFEENLKAKIVSQYIVHAKILHSVCSNEQVEELEIYCILRKQAINMKLNPKTSLETLAQLLYIAYKKRKIILLIDEYDAAPIADFIPNDLNKDLPPTADPNAMNYYKEFIFEILKEPASLQTVYLFVYITGILPISFEGMSAVKTEYLNYIISPEITPFFCIDNKTADSLMNSVGFNHTRKEEIRLACDCYESPHFPEITIYNPYSLFKFLRGTKEKYPWCEKSRTRFLSKAVLPDNLNAVYELTLLLGGRCIEYSYDFKQGFTFSQLETLKRQLLNWEENPTKQQFLTYLLCVGIVTLSTTEKEQHETLLLQPTERELKPCVRIANEENRQIIKDQLSINSDKKFDIINTSEILAKIVYNSTLPLSTFQMKIQSFLKYSDGNEHLIHGSELYYHAIFFCDIVRYLVRKYNYKYFLDYKFLSLKNKKTPDIVIYNNSHAAVFEIKYNNKPQLISDAKQGQLREYGLLFHKAYPKCKNLRLILIHIEETEQRTITVEITELDPITSEQGFLKLQTDYNNYIVKKPLKKQNHEMIKEEVQVQNLIPTTYTKNLKQLKPNVQGSPKYNDKTSPSSNITLNANTSPKTKRTYNLFV